MIEIERFIPFVQPFARGATDTACVHEIRNAAIEFCQRTKVWRELLDPPLDIAANIAEVELPLPDQSELVDVREVFYRKNPLDPISEDGLRVEGISPTDVGKPRFYTFTDEYVMRLAPIPLSSETQVLQVRVALHPTRDAEELPEPLFRRYAQAIGHGAVARLHAYDEEWARRARREAAATNTNYAAQFQISIDMVTSVVAKSNVRGRRRVTARYF